MTPFDKYVIFNKEWVKTKVYSFPKVQMNFTMKQKKELMREDARMSSIFLAALAALYLPDSFID